MLWDMSTGAPSPRDVISIYRATYDTQLAEKSLRPVVIPYQLVGFAVLFSYLFMPHLNRPWLYKARWAVLALIIGLEFQSISETRSLNMATGIAAGLLSGWSTILAFTWLVFNNPQLEARRVERRRKVTAVKKPLSSLPVGNVPESFGRESGTNGYVNVQTKSINSKVGPSAERMQTDQQSKSTPGSIEWDYFWQPYPENSAKDRASWVLDLILSWRGTGWNWAISPIPSLPSEVRLSLGEPVDARLSNSTGPTGLRRFDSLSTYCSVQVPKFILGYLLLDILKTVMMKDSYFLLGPNNYPPPQYLASLSPLLLGIYRRTISLFAIITSLQMAFALSPVFELFMLGTKNMGVRGEPWMYPTTWGSISGVLDRGIGGLWSGWWHQIFRFGFSAPTVYLIARQGIPPKSQQAKVIGLIIAFSISGYLHACASLAMFPTTNPIHAVIFFLLQIPAIIIQAEISKYFKWLPLPLRQVGNFIVTSTWMAATCNWLIDDFAAGGVWLYEPIPISPLRALGFGNEGDWWYCWEEFGIGWHRGKHWWDSGISM